ncbi:hypothetical protein CRG98_027632 [Punica granatum]|uniref:Uncharacterized protein n=1 Tax=Punica granatum TaxID=22663 RepID=A0A2I0J7W5_PUNGR|nr:hypothetical protein CRG98_027632 [Punica granatum]
MGMELPLRRRSDSQSSRAVAVAVGEGAAIGEAAEQGGSAAFDAPPHCYPSFPLFCFTSLCCKKAIK